MICGMPATWLISVAQQGFLFDAPTNHVGDLNMSKRLFSVSAGEDLDYAVTPDSVIIDDLESIQAMGAAMLHHIQAGGLDFGVKYKSVEGTSLTLDDGLVCWDPGDLKLISSAATLKVDKYGGMTLSWSFRNNSGKLTVDLDDGGVQFDGPTPTLAVNSGPSL